MKNLFKKILKFSRNKILGDFRSKKLSNIIINKILKYNKNKKNIKILDYGSGFQPRVIFFIHEKLRKKLNLKIEIDCYDFYTDKEIKSLTKKYKKGINFLNINSLKNKNYDFCLINDVLHHIDINREDLIIKILKKLLNSSKIVLIKDHFQKGFLSNSIIRLMDFLGNYFNDVKIPKKYYDNETFENLIIKIRARVIEKIISINLYPSYLLFMSNPDFHFIYLIKRKSQLKNK